MIDALRGLTAVQNINQGAEALDPNPSKALTYYRR